MFSFYGIHKIDTLKKFCLNINKFKYNIFIYKYTKVKVVLSISTQ